MHWTTCCSAVFPLLLSHSLCVWYGYRNLPYLCAHVKLCVVSSLINGGFSVVYQTLCAYMLSMEWHSFSWWIKYWLIYISIIRKRIIKIEASFSSYWLETEGERERVFVCVCVSECVMCICTYKWVDKHTHTVTFVFYDSSATIHRIFQQRL